MHTRHCVASGPIVGFALFLLQACGNAGSRSGVDGEYTSVNDDEVTLEFKSGGDVAASLGGGFGSSTGTFTVDGEKVVVDIDGVDYMFIRDGECIRDQNDVFGKLCKGGKAGEAANVSTRNVPTTPSGTYVATSADGEFRLDFKPGNTVTMIATPPGGQPETLDGSFTMEGDVIYATLPQGVPLVLKFVNDTYESTSFGTPLTFVKR